MQVAPGLKKAHHALLYELASKQHKTRKNETENNMTAKKANYTYNLDLANFTEGKAAAYSIFVGCPAFAREIDARAMGLDYGTDGANAKVKSVIKEGRKCLTLPDDIVQEFVSIRGRAKRVLQQYAIFFPFLPTTTQMVPDHVRTEMYTAMNELYEEFEALKKSLIEKLDSLRDAQRAKYEEVANVIFDAKPQKVERDEFVARFLKVFEYHFPSERDVNIRYTFDFKCVGSIQRSISLMSRDEFLKDAETQGKMKVMQAAEEKLQKEFFDWIASTALAVKVGLLKALHPVVNGMGEGRSIGRAVAERIESHVKRIRNMDLFGDKDFDALSKEVLDATDKLKDEVEGYAKSDAEEKLRDSLRDVQKSLQTLEFDPSNFRRLEMDDDTVQQAFTDKNVMKSIDERMQVQLSLAVKELSAKCGESAEARKEAEENLKRKLKLAEIAKEAEDEYEYGIKARGATLEFDAPEPNGDEPVAAATAKIETE